MERDREPVEAADAEEARAAAALAEALEGRSRDLDGCAEALETAALLRFSARDAELDAERSARIRGELLASPLVSAPRRALPRWTWWLPAALGACLLAILVQRASLDPPETHPTLASAEGAASEAPSAAGADHATATAQATPGDPAAAVEGMGAAARVSQSELGEVASSARQYRATLLASSGNAVLVRAHAALDAAASDAELEAAARSSRELLDAPGSDAFSDARGQLLRQDLFCRLAETALRLGQPREALEWTRRGLELDGEPNPFMAQLRSVEGQARASLGDQLGAARSYLQALELNEALLREHLDGP